MRVVTDTTPLNYLILIDHVAILPALFERVVIPQAVATELRHPRAPAAVRAWLEAPPAWCAIRQAANEPDAVLRQLGAGECEALVLMQELSADTLLTDDLEAREEAIRRGMGIMGTLGILERAALRELIDLPAAVARLQTTSFFPPPQIIAAMLARDAERKASGAPC
jgi:predicted nucleic acid-binding protein